MNKTIRFIFAAVIFCMVCGCVGKLVRIDSKPSFADIRINDELVGKTPMYHRFYDKWYPWPIKKTDDFLIQAQLPGYEPEVQIFQETPVLLDISYVPDEILFKMYPVKSEEDVE